MIKAVAEGNGRTTLVLGLTFENLSKFRRKPCDSFIKVDGAELGLPVDVMIFSAESDSALAQFMEQFIGPDTKLYLDPRLGS